MSAKHIGCKFCDKDMLKSDGSVIIISKGLQDDDYYHELHMLDDRTLTSYVTEADSMSPVSEINLHINYCPMCGRPLYLKAKEINKEYMYDDIQNSSKGKHYKRKNSTTK